MTPALHVLVTVLLVLIATASLPLASLLLLTAPMLAPAVLAAGFGALTVLLRWLGRSLEWGLPHPAAR